MAPAPRTRSVARPAPVVERRQTRSQTKKLAEAAAAAAVTPQPVQTVIQEFLNRNIPRQKRLAREASVSTTSELTPLPSSCTPSPLSPPPSAPHAPAPPAPAPILLELLRGAQELTEAEMIVIMARPEFQKMIASPPQPHLLDILREAPELTQEQMEAVTARPEFQRIYPPPLQPIFLDTLRSAQKLTSVQMEAVVVRPEFQEMKQQVISTLDITLTDVLDRKSTMNDADIEMLGSRHEFKMPNKLDKFLDKVGRWPSKVYSSTSAKMLSQGKGHSKSKSIKKPLKGMAVGTAFTSQIEGMASASQTVKRVFDGVAAVSSRQQTVIAVGSSATTGSGIIHRHSSTGSPTLDATNSRSTTSFAPVRTVSAMPAFPNLPVRPVRGESQQFGSSIIYQRHGKGLEEAMRRVN